MRNLPRLVMPPTVSVGTSVIDAIERARAIAAVEGTINQLRARIRNVQSKIDQAECRIQEKERLIRQSQGSFNQHDCFSLGFSHEMPNARWGLSGPRALFDLTESDRRSCFLFLPHHLIAWLYFGPMML